MALQPDETIEIDASQPSASDEPLEASPERRAARLTLYGGIALIVLGWIVLYVGYNGAATQPREVAQLPYIISGGFGGMSLVLLGGILLLAHLFLGLQSKLRSDLRGVAEALQDVADTMSRSAVAAGTASPNGRVLVLRGGSSFHRPGCRLISDRREVRHLDVEEAAGKGLSPCRVCRP